MPKRLSIILALVLTMLTPYATAAGMIFGKAGLQEFTEETVRDPAVLALTKKVKVTADDDFSAAFPAEQTAFVTVRTKDGASYTDRVDFPKGEPENPMTDAEFRSRYDGLMEYAGISAADAEAVFEAVRRKDSSADDLVKHL